MGEQLDSAELCLQEAFVACSYCGRIHVRRAHRMSGKS